MRDRCAGERRGFCVGGVIAVVGFSFFFFFFFNEVVVGFYGRWGLGKWRGRGESGKFLIT